MTEQAYLDPSTGLCFGNPNAVIGRFGRRTERMLAREAAAAAHESWLTEFSLLQREFTDVRQLPDLFKRMYSAWLEDKFRANVRRPAHPKYTMPTVSAVEVSNVELTCEPGKRGVFLQLKVLVTIDGSADVLLGNGVRMDPDRVLHPFEYAGEPVSNAFNCYATHEVGCKLRCKLEELPAFKAVVDRFDELLARADIHADSVTRQGEDALAKDAEYRALMKAAMQAARALEDAQVAHAAAQEAMDQRRADVISRAEGSGPFKHADALKQLEAAVGGISSAAMAALSL